MRARAVLATLPKSMGEEMKCSALLVLLAASALLAQTPRQITVQQLEQVLAWQRAHHMDDGAAARQLESVQLTRQLTNSTMARLEMEFHPGQETMEAMHLLADLSAFLPPPRNELPRNPAPDAAGQEQMIQFAAAFSRAALHHLPDFLATRTTRRFEDVPVIMPRRSYQSGLHLTGTFVRETAYRNGHEVNPDGPAATSAPEAGPTNADGLSSIGEFGQVLAIIMADSAQGTVTWDRWQQTPAGLVAVFDYRVPKSASHYRVHFCCEWSQTNHSESYDGTPDYSGSLSIDPASGAVLRLTLAVQFEGFDPPPLYQLTVNYAKIEIGGLSAILPIRSAVVGEETMPEKKREMFKLFINDVTFTNYHRFGSKMRILPAAQHR